MGTKKLILMFKMMSLQKRRPELTHEQFREYMETHHAPFALNELNKHTLGLRRYVRNYVEQTTDEPGLLSNQTYDVITEFWFNDKAAFEEFLKWHASDVAAPVRADEKRFINLPSTRVYLEEVEQLQILKPVEIKLPTDGKK